MNPCSWTVSPRIDRKSLNWSLSSLLLSISSSVSYRQIHLIWQGVGGINCHSLGCIMCKKKKNIFFILTCPSCWYNIPNLKLEETLCSSNVVIRSGAWGMKEIKEEFSCFNNWTTDAVREDLVGLRTEDLEREGGGWLAVVNHEKGTTKRRRKI